MFVSDLYLFLSQLNVKPWRRPLTMGHQCSEMKAEYRGRPEEIPSIIPHSGNPQPPKLADHCKDGPTKVSRSFSNEFQWRWLPPQNKVCHMDVTSWSPAPYKFAVAIFLLVTKAYPSSSPMDLWRFSSSCFCWRDAASNISCILYHCRTLCKCTPQVSTHTRFCY